jgi:hypothetical protein
LFSHVCVASRPMPSFCLEFLFVAKVTIILGCRKSGNNPCEDLPNLAMNTNL